jgi:glycosyltransferase involved in cell wall biosynthesis
MKRLINYVVPAWVEKLNLSYKEYKDVPDSFFKDLNTRLDQVQSKSPLVSIIIAAYNEEINVLRCINSLSYAKTNIPFEIIVVNNNSADHTQDSISRMNIRGLFQPIQGCGPARQLAQENANGKYILLADADCLYPPGWIEEMMKVLQQENVVCVYGRYSFIPEKGFSRLQLYLLEKLKDAAAEFRHLKRPHLNAFGISMGYVKALGLKEGFIMHNIRGDDGRLAFDLMKYGMIKQVKSMEARPWTAPRTLQRDGSFYKAISNRIIIELKRGVTMLKKEAPHDTKKSSN